MAKLDKCIEIIKAAIGRDLTPEEREAVHRNVVRVLAQAKDGSIPIKDLLDQIKDKDTASAIASKRTAIISQRVLADKEDLRKNNDAIARNPGDAIVDMNRGGLSARFGSKMSLGNKVKTEREARVAQYFTEIDQAGLKEYMANGNDDRNISLAKYWLQHGDAAKAAAYGKTANDAAKIMIKHDMAALKDAQKEGIDLHFNPDRITSNSHDPYSLGRAAGNAGGKFGSEAHRDAWIASLNKLDWKRSFGGEFAGSGPAERIARLRSQYQQLSQGNHLVWNDQARQMKDREFVWQTPEDEFEYQQKFGIGKTLQDKFMSNLGTLGRDIAIAKDWGPQAKGTMDKFVDRWEKELVTEQRGPEAKALRDNYNTMIKNDWPIITGDIGRPAGHVALAHYSAVLRAWQPLAKMGEVVLRQVGDLGTRAQILNRYGSRSVGGFLGHTFEGITNMLGLTGYDLTPEVRNYAARMGILLDDPHMPLANAHMMEQIGFGGVQKLDRQLMRFNGSQWWINRMRTNSGAETGVNHFQLKGKTYDQLPEGVREGFKQYGITDKGWDILRGTNGFDLGNGHKALDIRDVEGLDKSSFRSLATMSDPTDAHLARKQTELVDNYRNYVSDVANMAVNHPSYAVRAIMLQGHRAGDLVGEGLRQASVFKMWTTSYMRNFIGGELHGYSEDRVGNGEAMWRLLTMKDGGRGMTGLGTLIAGSIFWGYVTNTLRDVVAGKIPQNPLSSAPIKSASALPNPTEGTDALYRAVSTGSTAGLYSDFLLGGAHDFWNQVGEMAGPVAGSVGDVADTGAAALRGMKKYDDTGDTTALLKAGDKMLEAMEQQTPGRNFLYTKAALDYLILDNLSEALDPGWKQKKQQRLLQQHNQTYLMDQQ
jgi:hypothetical protein